MCRPVVNPQELLLKWRLSFVSQFIQGLSFIEQDINREMSEAAWRTVKDKFDLQRGPWNTRCRTWAILQGQD